MVLLETFSPPPSSTPPTSEQPLESLNNWNIINLSPSTNVKVPVGGTEATNVPTSSEQTDTRPDVLATVPHIMEKVTQPSTVSQEVTTFADSGGVDKAGAPVKQLTPSKSPKWAGYVKPMHKNGPDPRSLADRICTISPMLSFYFIRVTKPLLRPQN